MTSTANTDLLKVETSGDVTIAHFTRRTILAVEAIETVGERLLGLIREQGARKLILDFAQVESLTSGMLGKFVTLAREIETAGGQLVFCNVDPFLRQIFDLCNLPPQIAILPDVPGALAALQK